MLPKIFKSKAKYVLSLSRNSLSVYTLTGGSHNLTCDKKVIKNLEQFDSKLIEKRVKSFLDETGIKPGKSILVLENDILFSKKITRGKVSDKKINNFTSKIPIKPESLTTKVYKIGEKPIIISTNKSFYGVFKEILEKLDWNLVSVVPHIVLESKNLNLNSVKEIFDEEEIIKEASFLNKKRKESEINTKPIKIVLFTLIGLIILVPAGFFAYKYFSERSEKEEPDNKNQIVVETESNLENPPSVEETVDSTKQLEEQRQQLSLQILNGTGVAGLAGSLQEDISDFGYESITIGNAPTYNSIPTLVEYKAEVSDLVVDEIEEYLYTKFEEVTLEEISSETQIDNDIIITTGNLLEISEGGEELE